MLTKPSITFVTGNIGKVKEVNTYLGDSFNITNKPHDISEIQGDVPKKENICVQNFIHSSEEDVLKIDNMHTHYQIFTHTAQVTSAKAIECANFFNEPVLIEDSSLFIYELMNPGVFVKFWSSDAIYKASKGCDSQSAIAISTFGYCEPGSEPLIFIGGCKGKICSPDDGNGINGFGWDCIFKPEHCRNKSFAQITLEEKNEISHRAKAMELLKTKLHKHINKIDSEMIIFYDINTRCKL